MLEMYFIVIIIVIFSIIITISIVFNAKNYEPKDQDDIELENAYINSLKVKDTEIFKPKATETHNSYGKIEDIE